MSKKTIKLQDSIKGASVRVITDLNTSATYIKDRKKYIEKDGRIYSVKGREGSAWKLAGHSPRLLMSAVTSTTSETARLKVLETGQKAPHSFLDGKLESFDISDHEHEQIIAKLLANGAKYLAYNPYKTKTFVLIDTPHLPGDCTGLAPFKSAKLVYCFEDSVLALF